MAKKKAAKKVPTTEAPGQLVCNSKVWEVIKAVCEDYGENMDTEDGVYSVVLGGAVDALRRLYDLSTDDAVFTFLHLFHFAPSKFLAGDEAPEDMFMVLTMKEWKAHCKQLAKSLGTPPQALVLPQVRR